MEEVSTLAIFLYFPDANRELVKVSNYKHSSKTILRSDFLEPLDMRDIYEHTPPPLCSKVN